MNSNRRASVPTPSCDDVSALGGIQCERIAALFDWDT
jgi:hypothetical protein